MIRKTVFVATLAAVALIGCKKGSISGEVKDAFTGKPLENAYPQVLNTAYRTELPTGADGKFSIPEVKPGKYTLRTGRDLSSKSLVEFEISETNLNPTVEVFLYENPKSLKPGLYAKSDKGPEKILNEWAGYDFRCADNIKGFRLDYLKKKLPDATSRAAEVDLYFRQLAAGADVTIKSALLAKGNVADHKDCVKMKGEKSALFADFNTATELKTKYVSEGLVEVKGTLPKGPQMLIASEGEKTIAAYYFDVK